MHTIRSVWLKRLAACAALGTIIGCLPAIASAQPIQSLDSIRQAARAFAREQARSQVKGSVQVSVSHPDSRLRLPRCSQPLRAFLPPGGRLVGNISVGVRCDTSRPWTLYVPVTVSVRRRVVVLRHAMARGQTLSAGDLTLRTRNLAQLSFGYLTSLSAATGDRLLRPAQAGTVLNPSMLQAPLMVHRGQTVTLIAGSGGLSVEMSGKALANGAMGDVVHVQNVHSQQVVAGVVTGQGQVRVGAYGS